MSDFNLKIEDTQIKAALSEAILSSITAESRDAMLREALANVLAPVKATTYQKAGPSLVEEAFGNSVGIFARKVVHELVNNDPDIRRQVEAVIRELLVKLLDQTATTDALANMITKQLERANY
jgi:hypothetical protein